MAEIWCSGVLIPASEYSLKKTPHWQRHSGPLTSSYAAYQQLRREHVWRYHTIDLEWPPRSPVLTAISQMWKPRLKTRADLPTISHPIRGWTSPETLSGQPRASGSAEHHGQPQTPGQKSPGQSLPLGQLHIGNPAKWQRRAWSHLSLTM